MPRRAARARRSTSIVVHSGRGGPGGRRSARPSRRRSRRRWRGTCRRRRAAPRARSCRCGGRRGRGSGSCVVEVEQRVDGGDGDRRAAALAAVGHAREARTRASAALASAAPTKPTGRPTISAGFGGGCAISSASAVGRVADHPDRAGRRLGGGQPHRGGGAGRRPSRRVARGSSSGTIGARDVIPAAAMRASQ